MYALTINHMHWEMGNSRGLKLADPSAWIPELSIIIIIIIIISSGDIQPSTVVSGQ